MATRSPFRELNPRKGTETCYCHQYLGKKQLAFRELNPRKGTETLAVVGLLSLYRRTLSANLIPARGLKQQIDAAWDMAVAELSANLIPARGLKLLKLFPRVLNLCKLSANLIPARGLKLTRPAYLVCQLCLFPRT